MSIGNTRDLREFLIEQMGKVVSGEQSATDAKAICNYSQQVYNTLNAEIKMAQAKAKLGDNAVGPVEF